MAELIKVSTSMFDELAEVLQLLAGPRKSIERYRSLFHPPWDTHEDYCGYALADKGKIRGFMAYVFSRRHMSGETEKFCNLTTWVVVPEYRFASLRLLSPLADLRECTVTDFTPTPVAVKALRAFRFQVLEDSAYVLLPVPRAATRGITVTVDPARIRPALHDVDRQTFDDHTSTLCRHMLLRGGLGEACYLITTRRKYRGMPITHVHHISDAETFLRHQATIRLQLAVRNLTPIVLVDARMLPTRPAASVRVSYPTPRLYLPSPGLLPADIDNLYSEIVLMPV